MLLDGAFLVPEDAEAAAGSTRLDRTQRNAHVDVEFALSWRSAEAVHTDVYAAFNLNLWRDWMPPEIESLLLDKPRGQTGNLKLARGTLVEEGSPRDVLDIPLARFNKRHRKNLVVEPRAGRFYPKGYIAGVRDIYSEDFTPFRVGTVNGGTLTVDLGHPLAGHEVTLGANILDIRQATSERGGRAQDVQQLIAGNGPGMQARWRSQPTDFFADEPFARGDADDDAVFYSRPRFVNHLDSTALKQVRRHYARLIPRGARVLDLMSSMNSHLDPGLELSSVVGLGMNADELAANERLNQRVVHDLNREPRLPFADADFDAVICTVSVEYLVHPFEVFREVARALRPGGKFVVTFSNRWFPPKAVSIWTDLHPFERMGLVLEYFLESSRFKNLGTFSLTGLPRPADDKYASQMQWSDPIYSVWGEAA
jgi:FKBP-type peptidyl-prolyl cis-trans isomerase 2